MPGVLRFRNALAPHVGSGSSSDDNSFFDYLLTTPQYSSGRSWRPTVGQLTNAHPYYQYQLSRYNGAHDGDLQARADQEGLYVSYSPGTDTDPQKQDATKLRMPMWMGADNNNLGVLEVAMDASTTTVDMKASYVHGGPFDPYVPSDSYYSVVGRDYRIDNEIVTCAGWNNATKQMTVSRAQHGSTATTHAVNTLVRMATQSLQTQLWTDVNLAEGETGLFYWEFFVADIWKSVNWDFTGGMKTFQLHNGALYLEPGLDFGNAPISGHGSRACYTRYTDAFNWRVRPYTTALNSNPTWSTTREGEPGPGWGDYSEDLQPTASTNLEYCGDSGLWNRVLMRVDFRTGDWLHFDMWIWDKNSAAPVKVLSDALMGAGNHNTSRTPRDPFNNFFQEWNYSEEEFHWGDVSRIDTELIAYIKNFAFLKSTGTKTTSALTDAYIDALFARSDWRPA